MKAGLVRVDKKYFCNNLLIAFLFTNLELKQSDALLTVHLISLNNPHLIVACLIYKGTLKSSCEKNEEDIFSIREIDNF